MRHHLMTVALLVGVAGLVGCKPTSAAKGVTVTDRSAGADVAAGGVRSVTATCNAGEEAVGGGYGIAAGRYAQELPAGLPADLYPVVENYPSGTAAWTVTVFNRDKAGVLVTAHVECVSASVGVKAASAQAAPGPDAQAVASCPGGATMVTGGGWRVSDVTRAREVVAVTASRANPGRTPGWLVAARPASRSTATPQRNRLTAFAVCATKVLAPGSYSTAKATASSGKAQTATDATAEVRCGGDELLTGAAHTVTQGEAGITTFFPRAGSGAAWVLTLYSLPGQGFEGTVNSGATAALAPVCAKVT